MKYIFFLLLTCLPFLSLYAQDCSSEQNTLIIKITTDRFGRETSWILSDIDSIYKEVKREEYDGALVDIDTFCIDKEACLIFSIFDGFGDGIQSGGYEIFLNGDLIAQNNDFGFTETVEINCKEGTACSKAIPVMEGMYETTSKNAWYVFTPDTVGTYEITTCGATTCDTQIFVYDRCSSVQVGDNEGFIFFNEDACGNQSTVNALLDAGLSYLIRINNKVAGCSDNTIAWSLTYKGPIVGCMEKDACNYNPLATIADNSCLPLGDPNCPKGPDLQIREDILRNSIEVATIENDDDCLINEGCLKGFGTREIIRFTTRFENIGEQDYFIGEPSTESSQFTFDNCHNHFHYDNYAEYVLYDEQGNRLPAGFKSGFCVVDLVCTSGNNKYGCNNMGLTVGCFDEYGSNLDCQWIDVTDYPDGNYTFVARVNWGNQPDAIGRIEQDLSNNWSQACLQLDRSSGKLIATVSADCPDFRDCEGTLFGGVEKDCMGICGGTTLYADIDGDALQNQQDVQEYFSMIVEEDQLVTPCNDLNNDGVLTIYDAALLADCLSFGRNHEHPEQGIHDHCDFPNGIINTLDTVNIRIQALDVTNRTIDLAIQNSRTNVVAFQLQMVGITIQSVESLMDSLAFPVQLQSTISTASVLGLVKEGGKSLAKSREFQPFLRIHYLELKETQVCIQQVQEIVNEGFQQVMTTFEEACIEVMLTNTEETAFIPKPLKIVPNPTNQSSQIIFSNPTQEKSTLKIFNATGTLVHYATNITANQYLFTATDLPTGLYLLHLKNNKDYFVGKLVVF